MCTRSHKGKRIAGLVADAVWHPKRNGPRRYRLSENYYTPEVNAACSELVDAERFKGRLSVLML